MILVTGATGFVGRKLATALDRRGMASVCLVREGSRWEEVRGSAPSTEFVFGSLLDAGAVSEVFAKRHIHTVVHLAATHDAASSDLVYRSNVESTRNLLAAARRCGTRRFLYVSSVLADEKSESPYEASKKACENLVTESGVPCLILRPTLIYGEVHRDLTMSKLIRTVLRKRFVPVIGDGSFSMQPIYIDDVVHYILAALATDGWKGKSIEIGGKDRFSFNELLDLLGRYFHKTVHKVHIPMRLVLSLVWCYQRLRPGTQMNVHKVKMFVTPQQVDITEACDAFGHVPLSFEQGLRAWSAVRSFA